MSEFLACIRPDQVTEGDYLAYLDHASRPEFERHLAECEFCRRELQVYRNLDDKLRRQFEFISSPARTMCPETHLVGEFVGGFLSGLEADKMRRHLTTCDWCTAEVTQLRQWLQESDPLLEEQPARPPDQSQNAGFEWLRRVVASLLKPQTLSYAETGVRGTTEGLPQTYQAEELTIVLTVQPVNSRSQVLNILGLVQTDTGSLDELIGRKIRLSSQGQEVASEALDELGNFIFENIQTPQPFDLEIMLETRIIIVPDVQMN